MPEKWPGLVLKSQGTRFWLEDRPVARQEQVVVLEEHLVALEARTAAAQVRLILPENRLAALAERVSPWRAGFRPRRRALPRSSVR